jgi:recombining binding protein (suppressor of hairless)
MSIDFSSQLPTTQHTLYPQTDVDQSFTTLHNGPSSPAHPHVAPPIQGHHYEHTEGISSVQEQPHYDLFSNSPSSNSFASQRYRTNASSSSSLGPTYNNMNGDTIYPHPSFGDNVPSFSGSNRNTFEMMGISSSYSSGKVSPNDGTGPLPPVSAFPPSVGMNGLQKEYSHSNYHDIVPDRRLAGVNYQSEYHDDFPVNSALSFPPPPNSHHYADRVSRFPSDDRYSHSSAAHSTVPSHSHSSHSHDMLRGVAPLATHVFRSDGALHNNGYDDLHYSTPGHPEMSLRMPSVDETLSRMKLQGHSIMGASNDLRTFIRRVITPIGIGACASSTHGFHRFRCILQTTSRSIRSHPESSSIWRALRHCYVQQGCPKVLRNGETVSHVPS